MSTTQSKLNRLHGANDIEKKQLVQDKYGHIPPRRMSPRTRSKRAAQQLIQDDAISSSTPAIFDDEIYGPLLMQRLDGFLIIINPVTRIIQHVTSNIERHTEYTVDQIKGNIIDNILHPNDVIDFKTTQKSLMTSRGRNKPRLRLQMKIGFEQYSPTDIMLDLVKHQGEISVVCCVERMGSNMLLRDPTIQEFATKIKRDGTICSIEVSGVAQHYWTHLNESLRGRKIQDLCFERDAVIFKKFLTDVVVQQQAELEHSRWALEDDFSINISTVAKFFKANPMFSLSVDFIMCVHTIVS